MNIAQGGALVILRVPGHPDPLPGHFLDPLAVHQPTLSYSLPLSKTVSSVGRNVTARPTHGRILEIGGVQKERSWLLLAPPGPSWLLLAPPGSSWFLLAPPAPSWLLLAPPGSSWPLLVPPGSSWPLLAPPGASWLHLTPPGAPGP